MLNPEQIKQLEAKLDPKNIKTRQLGGKEMSYIEGWHAISEANKIFGFDKWNRETTEIKMVSERQRTIGKDQYQKDGWGVTYIAKVRITIGDIVREGCGSGHGIDADLGSAHESAIKEAETDAMKRAFMTFGNPFGLALYDKQQNGVDKVIPMPIGDIKSIASKISLDVDASWTWEALDKIRSMYRSQIERMPQKWAEAQIKKFDDKGAELKAKGINKQPAGAVV